MLRRLHPLPKLVLCLAWIIASLLVFRLSFQIAVFGVAAGLLALDARVPPLRLLALCVPFALFGMGFFTTSILFGADTGFAVQMAREQGGAVDVAPGLVLFFRVLACGMVSACFALTTDPGQFVRALMIHLRLPASAGYALLHAMHLVPDLGRETLHLRMARAVRLDRPLRRIASPAEVLDLAIPLLAYAIRRASRAAVSFEARGLRAGQARSHLPQPPIGARDWAIVGLGLSVLAATVVACTG